MTSLPYRWTVESLGNIAAGGHFTDGDWVESKDQDSTGDVRLTQLADVGTGAFRDRSDRWMRPDQAERLRCTFLRPGDLLIARMPEPLGRCCLVPDHVGRAVTVVDVAILRIARRDIDHRYVKWALNSPGVHEAMVALQTGTTRKRISRKRLSQIAIPLPPVEEQRQIVDILEDHLSRLDAADESLRLTGLRANAWRMSFVDEMFWHSGSSEKPVATLLSEPLRNGHSARASADGRGIRTLTLTAVTLGSFSPEYTKMTVADPDRVSNLWLRSGDILVERSNTAELVGTTAHYDGPDEWAIFPDLIIRARIDGNVARSKFVGAAMSSARAHRWLRSRAKGLSGSMPKIDQATIGALTVPVPRLDQQDAVLARMAEILPTPERMAASAVSARQRTIALRRALLQAAFSGQLTGRSSDLDRAAEAVG